jgi:transcriptional regulator with XRE-family HTH domain
MYSRWETGDVTPHFDTIMLLADVLAVSLDELAGRKDVSSETGIRNPELNRLCRKVDQLPDEDQRALAIVLDSLVKRSKVRKVMAET